jgi:hypothetical protein
MTPVKEIVEVVVQSPVEYEEADMESPMEKPVVTETPVEKPVVIPSVQSQVTKRNSKETLKKKQVTPTIYQPSFTQVYVLPLLPFMALLLLLVIVSTMRL